MAPNQEALINYLNREFKAFQESFSHGEINTYYHFYQDIDFPLQQIFSALHYELNQIFDHLNDRIPHEYFHADDSRYLLKRISDIYNFQKKLHNTMYQFQITDYYQETFNKCKEFLKPGGSPIPQSFDEIDIEEFQPIFRLDSTVEIDRPNSMDSYQLEEIGHGSYATVYKYEDPYYNRTFAVKKAFDNIPERDYTRFVTEFNEMKKLNSPFILEVYRFEENQRQYIMEYVDETLNDFLKNPSNSNPSIKFLIIKQIFKAFKYIHSKKVYHRDISTSNVLIKKYEDGIMVKLSDFGFVKLEQSEFTQKHTDVRGSLNDPNLHSRGFATYGVRDEVYALTRLLYIILTGRETTGAYINDKFDEFYNKGTHSVLDERFNDVAEMETAFFACFKN
ncbi:protein kinase domain-containing protein [Bacillus cereus]|uniref:protein kinase domain-containing protein n=1 Tax=Bacillus cereus TaxID=1396 RepID=UPI000B4AEF33|nr:protein kinase [Bacillus cereus]